MGLKENQKIRMRSKSIYFIQEQLIPDEHGEISLDDNYCQLDYNFFAQMETIYGSKEYERSRT